jgi:hypothetical protein
LTCAELPPASRLGSLAEKNDEVDDAAGCWHGTRDLRRLVQVGHPANATYRTSLFWILHLKRDAEEQINAGTKPQTFDHRLLFTVRRFMPREVVMAKFSLDTINVASPCPVEWDTMGGDDKVRFCSQCQLHVYNFSAMSRDEAEQLVARTEGKLCGRFWRRADGTVITQDCPVGLQAARRRLRLILAGAATAVLMVVGFVLSNLSSPRGYEYGRWRVSDIEPFHTLLEWIAPSPPPPPQVTMGDICIPSPVQQPEVLPAPVEEQNKD